MFLGRGAMFEAWCSRKESDPFRDLSASVAAVQDSGSGEGRGASESFRPNLAGS